VKPPTTPEDSATRTSEESGDICACM
jgi:hypothetical protein